LLFTSHLKNQIAGLQIDTFTYYNIANVPLYGVHFPESLG
ncbi:MAG: hypothetical protein ACJAW1_001067, partial [Glaciecola sp.]